MEFTSAPLHKGQIPWILLTASLLTYWNSPTTAQVTVEAVPPNVAEGENVLLLVRNLQEALQAFSWYKGDGVSDREIARFVVSSKTNITGPAYSGRETIYHNGSLQIQTVTKNDTGTYTLNMIDANFGTKQISVRFQVYPPLPKPSITSNNSNPMEGEDSVALMCEPKSENTSYLWRRNGQTISDGDSRLKLSEGNRTLTLLNVSRTDTGPYECETWNPVSANRSDPFTLNITYGPDVPVISPSDIHFPPGANLSLSCHAASHPPAQYSWLINGKPESSSHELFIPNITTNNSGTYACLVHNSVTGLNRTTVKNITVLEPVTQPFIQITNTTVKELDSVFLTCFSNDTGISIHWVFNGQSLLLTERMTLSQNNSTLRIDPVKREDAGEYQCEVSNPVSFMRSSPIQLDIIIDPTQGSSGLSGGAIAGIVVGAVAGVALIAALAYFLYYRKTGGGSDQRDLTEHKPSASSHNLGPYDNAPNKVDEVTYTVPNFNAQQPKQPTSAYSSPRATETVYSEVKKK